MRQLSLLIATLSQIAAVWGALPTLNEIVQSRDPVLLQIFRESRIDLSGRTVYSEPPPTFTRNGGGGPGEVAIDHRSSLGQGIDRNQQTADLEGGITRLATDGASVLYKGAQTVGQAFGIRGGDYHIPLLDQAAGLFGRR